MDEYSSENIVDFTDDCFNEDELEELFLVTENCGKVDFEINFHLQNKLNF